MKSDHVKRREFVQQSAVLASAGAIFPSGAHAQGKDVDKIRVALIGCGGRGTGAAAQALTADDRTELWAMGDIHEGQLSRSEEVLTKNAPRPEQVNVSAERKFIGLDAFQKVMALDDVDVVILTTPPGFRPQHFEEAVAAGKHVFMEKPVAVDSPGIRQVLAAAKVAKEKNLKVGVGFNRRHSPLHRETISRIHNGDIGEIPLIQMFNCRADVNKRNVREDGQSELEFQVRNWYYFTWLSGDFMVEQSVHDFDVVKWIKHEANPVSCQGQGGRLVRKGPMNGHIYDHYSVDFQYADGSQVITQHRHIPGCWNWIGEKITGTNGTAEIASKSKGSVRSNDPKIAPWRDTEKANSYQLEHDALFKAIREDLPHNEAEHSAYSTLFPIMGRMAAYTGKVVTWEEALNSEERLGISPTSWDEEPPCYPDENGEYETFLPGASYKAAL